MLTTYPKWSILPTVLCVCTLASAKADGTHAPIGDAIHDVPIFDAHVHYKEPAWDAYPVKSIIELMDRNRVAMALVSSTPDEGTIMLWEYAPNRIVPELRPYPVTRDLRTGLKPPQCKAISKSVWTDIPMKESVSFIFTDWINQTHRFFATS